MLYKCKEDRLFLPMHIWKTFTSDQSNTRCPSLKEMLRELLRSGVEMCLLWSFISYLETREIWKSLCCFLNITVSLNVSFQHQLFVVTCDVECKSSWSVKQLPRKIIALIFLIKILDLKQTIITLKQSKCYILSKNGKEIWVPLFHYF